MPSLLERQGDFSQTTDNNGALFNLIRDASTGLPCTAADTRGCFQDGGVLGRIPQDRLYQLGLNVLKQWPVPNATGLNYNLQTVAPTDVRLTHQPTVRVDWVPSSRLRLSAKYAGQRATVKNTPGSIPGFNDTLSRFPYITVGSGTVDYTLTPTTVMEDLWRLPGRTSRASAADGRQDESLQRRPLRFSDAVPRRGHRASRQLPGKSAEGCGYTPTSSTAGSSWHRRSPGGAGLAEARQT